MNEKMDRIRGVLRATPRHWEALAAHVPEELLYRAPAEDEWCALQCLAHMVDAEGVVFAGRLQAFLRGETMPAFDPDRPKTDYRAQSAAGLAAEFARLRAESLELLERLTDGDLERMVRRPNGDELRFGRLMHLWAAHDFDHTIQAERALMQPLIDGMEGWAAAMEHHRVRAQAEAETG